MSRVSCEVLWYSWHSGKTDVGTKMLYLTWYTLDWLDLSVYFKKSRIRETKNLSTDADISTAAKKLSSMFSIDPALRPGQFIVLQCLFACLFVAMLVPPHIFLTDLV